MKYKEPYRQPKSIIHQAFQMAKNGTTDDKVIALVAKYRGSPLRVLKELKKGHGGGFIWDVEEHGSRFKIMNIRPEPKLR